MNGEYTMGVFVDIEGAFDCAPFQKLCDITRAHGFNDALIKWIHAILTQRFLSAEVGVDSYLTVEGLPPRRCAFATSVEYVDRLPNLPIHAQA